MGEEWEKYLEIAYLDHDSSENFCAGFCHFVLNLGPKSAKTVVF
jgi:hypothetical protein